LEALVANPGFGWGGLRSKAVEELSNNGITEGLTV